MGLATLGLRSTIWNVSWSLLLCDSRSTFSFESSLADMKKAERVALIGSSSLTLNAKVPDITNGPSGRVDRKSTRLNSSHANISYAVFCLKKKKKQQAFSSV